MTPITLNMTSITTLQRNEFIEPLWPIHGGNPESLEDAEWIFDDNLIALLQVSTLPGRLQWKEGGQPENETSCDDLPSPCFFNHEI